MLIIYIQVIIILLHVTVICVDFPFFIYFFLSSFLCIKIYESMNRKRSYVCLLFDILTSFMAFFLLTYLYILILVPWFYHTHHRWPFLVTEKWFLHAFTLYDRVPETILQNFTQQNQPMLTFNNLRVFINYTVSIQAVASSIGKNKKPFEGKQKKKNKKTIIFFIDLIIFPLEE